MVELGVALFVVIVAVVLIYLFVELKRARHKFFAIFMILLIVFAYVSFVYFFKGRNVDFKTVPGVIGATKLYFSWLFSVFQNLKGVTSYAVKMNWADNETALGK
jgi:hypothetical protein